jgi:hypothetical protein
VPPTACGATEDLARSAYGALLGYADTEIAYVKEALKYEERKLRKIVGGRWTFRKDETLASRSRARYLLTSFEAPQVTAH